MTGPAKNAKGTETMLRMWMLLRNVINSFLKKGTSYAILVVIVLASVIIIPSFFRTQNLINISEQAAPLLIVSIGQTFAVLVSGIDLSVASVLSCTNIILASTTGGSNERAMPITGLCLVFGFGVGLLNGWCIVKRRVPAFIMTLGMAIVLEGGRLVYTKGSAYGYIPSIIQLVSKGRGGIFPFYIFIPIVIAVAALILLKRSAFGREVYAIGGNVKAAFISGVRTDRVRMACYVICSVMAVISGILLSGYLGVADNWAAKGYDLDSIAAVAVGGTAFSGGIGGVGGTIAGVLLIVLISNFLLFFGLGIETQLIGKAFIVILAVSVYIRLKNIRLS
ncbi:MAG: ABC transporter permease [Spirochaetia bacterium]|jgi:ribose/xylose/arabinose/galactoside ABC-type transport system permease subunit